MSVQFEQKILRFIAEDNFLETVPLYAQRGRVTARLSSQAKELSAAGVRSESALADLERAFAEFGAAREAALKQKEKCRAAEERLAREEEKAEKSRDISEGLQTKYKEQQNDLAEMRAALDAAFERDLAAREEELRAEENGISLRRQRLRTAEALRAQLDEHREKLFADIDQVNEENDGRLAAKQRLLAEMEHKLTESFGALSLETAAPTQSGDGAAAFVARYSADCQRFAAEWERLYSAESDRRLAALNAHVDRLQRMRPTVDAALGELRARLWTALGRLVEKAEENAELRAKTNAEQLKQTVFEKLRIELECKKCA